MAYMRDYPPRIAFFSCRTAQEGGATTICDMRRVTGNLPPSVVDKISRLGIRNVRNYAPYRESGEVIRTNPDSVPWNRAFPVGSMEEVTDLCDRMGMQAIWRDDGSLTLINHIPGFSAHPLTDERIYRGNIHSGGLSTTSTTDAERKALHHRDLPSGHSLGDGSGLDADELAAFRAVIDEATVSWQWRDGDLMILDNLLVGHGREPYRGPRDQQVALFCAMER
jgi:hypothetical protein